jgi:hypothetical protein
LQRFRRQLTVYNELSASAGDCPVAQTQSVTMRNSLWKVHHRLELRNPRTQAYQFADAGETLEEVTTPGTTDSPDDVRVYRTKERHTIQSYIVSRFALEANATLSTE